jgi:hypothetical protein
VGIFKDEARGLREWVEHYAWQGADAILLLDNGSRDDWRAALRGLAARLGGAGVELAVLSAPARHAQERHYNELALPWLEARGVEFAAVVDIDEFLFVGEDGGGGVGGGATLKSAALAAFAAGAGGAQAAQLTCPFHHFGSGGFEKQPRSVRACFTQRSASTSAPAHGKSVVRLADLEKFRIHVHEVAGAGAGANSSVGGGAASAAGAADTDAGPPPGACPRGLLLFHYKTQSREYWREVKMPRGDASALHYEAARDWGFFERDDRAGNAERDSRLRDAVLARGGAAPADCDV